MNEQPRWSTMLASAWLALGSALAYGGDGGLSASAGWARALPPTTRHGAVYVQVHNAGETTRLTGASTSAAERVELHTHDMVDGVARMRRLDAVDVPAHTGVEFAPGGHHLMLIDLTAPLGVGDRFPLTLEFEDGTRLATEINVMPLDHQPANATHSSGHESHHKH